MNREFWLDGFNFFHHWEATRGWLRSDSGLDIVRAIDRSLRSLGRQLAHRCRSTVVYLDGGLSRSEVRIGSLRVRYCGPGRKADDRMADDAAELGGSAGLVTAVSNDRELKARLRILGASCLGVAEFLAAIEGKKTPASGKRGAKTAKAGKAAKGGTKGISAADNAEIMRQKCRSLSESEVDAWLEFFGGDEEAGAEPPEKT